jgi:hypothetical protein
VAALSTVPLAGCSSSTKHATPPVVRGLLAIPTCSLPDAWPLAVVESYAKGESGIARPAVVCGGKLQLGAADQRFGYISAVAKTGQGLVAVDSRRGQRDHLVLLKPDGQRQDLAIGVTGTSDDPVADRHGALFYTGYDTSTQRFVVQKQTTPGNAQTLWHGSVPSVFTVGVAADGRLAVPIMPTEVPASGPLPGEIDLVSKSGSVTRRLTELPGIPTDIYWLNGSTLLVRFDVSRQAAADYLVPMDGGSPTAFGDGWLSLCPTPHGIVLARLDGTIGLLPPGPTASSAVEVIGKLAKLPLSCAAL